MFSWFRAFARNQSLAFFQDPDKVAFTKGDRGFAETARELSCFRLASARTTLKACGLALF
jgi:hypothetical protein